MIPPPPSLTSYRDKEQKLVFSSADESMKYKVISLHSVTVTMLWLHVDIKQVLGILLNDGKKLTERVKVFSLAVDGATGFYLLA